MSILGKILALLNLFALVAFLALGTMTLQKRTMWAHAVLRHDLALDGLPVDEKEIDIKGHPRADNLSDAVLKEMLGDSNVRTQMQELKKFEGRLKADIDNAEVAKGQSPDQKRAWVLMKMATTLDERQDLLAFWSYEANPNKNVYPAAERERMEKIRAKLPERIDALFSDSTLGGLPAPGGEDAKKLAGQEKAHKKRAIARVLVNLHDTFPDPAAGQTPAPKDPFEVRSYQRVLNVCGVKAVAHELEVQARLQALMAERLGELVEQDRLAFADVHQLLLYQVLDKAQQLGRAQLVLRDHTDKAKVQEDKAKEQEDKVKDVTAKLDSAVTQTTQELDKIAKLQDRLFKTRLALRDANTLNQQLEQEIRRLERQTGRPGRSRPPVPGEAQP